MKLGKRLEAVASFVYGEGRIVDVGSNHGYLCVYFALQHRKEDIIATDCNPKSLWEAKRNIRRYHLDSQIKIMIMDGLEKLKICPTDNIIIAGMGTRTIKSILTPDVLSHGNHFIIQSNNYLYELRLYMMKQGFKICNEKVVCEHGKYYVIIDFTKGNSIYTTEELKYGPWLLRQKNHDYFDYLYNVHLHRLNKIPKNQLNSIKEKQQELLVLKKIRDEL